MEEMFVPQTFVGQSFFTDDAQALRREANKAAPDQEDRDLIAKRYFYMEKFFNDGQAKNMNWYRIK